MKGYPRGHTRGEFAGGASQSGLLRVPILVTMTMTGATGIGFGTAVIGDFPEGNILFLGCVAYLEFAGDVTGDLADTWSGDFGVGTTPLTDGTISAGDVDLVPSTAVGPAVAEVSPKTRGAEADGSLSGVIFDNTDGSLEINGNLLVDDADISGDTAVVTVTGELYINFVVLGND